MGCDSIVELDLLIYPSTAQNISRASPPPFFWEATGETYLRSGTYTAQLVSEQGCDSTLALDLEIIKPNNYFVPNIFTPNADGDNDFFAIYGNENLTGIVRLQVFDRWGNLVFDRDNLPPQSAGLRMGRYHRTTRRSVFVCCRTRLPGRAATKDQRQCSIASLKMNPRQKILFAGDFGKER